MQLSISTRASATTAPVDGVDKFSPWALAKANALAIRIKKAMLKNQ
jgi:hypothetical protein